MIILDMPCTFSMKALIGGPRLPLSLEPRAHGARRPAAAQWQRRPMIVWCDVEPCYVFHPCNGFDTDRRQSHS
ncbi:MAG: hypothetical protein V9H26_15905 [Verrucomicrobiota bacterium]